MRPKIHPKPRISQGDIYRDVEFIEYVIEKKGDIELSKIVFPLVIILTQDCDLEQDYKIRWSRKKPNNQDKMLLSVLVAPLYNVEHIYQGEHLSELGLQMQSISKKSTHSNFLRHNEIPRYHYLLFPQNINIVPSVIDFKHYFSVNIEYIKKIKRKQFVCSIPPLHREEISHRFASFLSRIGLPSYEKEVT